MLLKKHASKGWSTVTKATKTLGVLRRMQGAGPFGGKKGEIASILEQGHAESALNQEINDNVSIESAATGPSLSSNEVSLKGIKSEIGERTKLPVLGQRRSSTVARRRSSSIKMDPKKPAGVMPVDSDDQSMSSLGSIDAFQSTDINNISRKRRRSSKIKKVSKGDNNPSARGERRRSSASKIANQRRKSSGVKP